LKRESKIFEDGIEDKRIDKGAKSNLIFGRGAPTLFRIGSMGYHTSSLHPTTKTHNS
jgi:hypothetical protein